MSSSNNAPSRIQEAIKAFTEIADPCIECDEQLDENYTVVNANFGDGQEIRFRICSKCMEKMGEEE